MTSRFSAYRLSLGLIWHDFKLLYTNFFHWNFSKITINLFVILLGFLISLPFIIAILAFGYVLLWNAPTESLSYFLSSGMLDPTLSKILNEHFWTFMVLFAMVGVAFFFSFTYAFVLLLNVYRGYLWGKKIKAKENLFFSGKYLWKFSGVFFWTLIRLLPPILVGLLVLLALYVLVILGLLDPNSSRTDAMILGTLSLIGLGIPFLWFVIRGIRLSFGYMYLLDDMTMDGREMVRKSLELSKGKVRQIILLALPFALVLGTLSGGLEYTRSAMVESKVANIINNAAASDTSFGDDHAYVKEHFLNPLTLSENDLKMIIAINNYYNPKTNGVDREYLHEMMPYITIPDEFSTAADDVRDIFFYMVQFLFLNDALLMVYYSIFSILKSTKKEENAKMEAETNVNVV